MRVVLFYCGICAVLLLLALTFRSLGDPRQGGLLITGSLLCASFGIIAAICRQGK